jgi:hypothetical protein
MRRLHLTMTRLYRSGRDAVCGIPLRAFRSLPPWFALALATYLPWGLVRRACDYIRASATAPAVPLRDVGEAVLAAHAATLMAVTVGWVVAGDTVTGAVWAVLRGALSYLLRQAQLGVLLASFVLLWGGLGFLGALDDPRRRHEARAIVRAGTEQWGRLAFLGGGACALRFFESPALAELSLLVFGLRLVLLPFTLASAAGVAITWVGKTSERGASQVRNSLGITLVLGGMCAWMELFASRPLTVARDGGVSASAAKTMPEGADAASTVVVWHALATDVFVDMLAVGALMLIGLVLPVLPARAAAACRVPAIPVIGGLLMRCCDDAEAKRAPLASAASHAPSPWTAGLPAGVTASLTAAHFAWLNIRHRVATASATELRIAFAVGSLALAYARHWLPFPRNPSPWLLHWRASSWLSLAATTLRILCVCVLRTGMLVGIPVALRRIEIVSRYLDAADFDNSWLGRIGRSEAVRRPLFAAALSACSALTLGQALLFDAESPPRFH